MEGQLGKSTSMAQLTQLLLAEWSHRAEPGHGAPGLPGQILYLTFFFKDFIYLFLERGREGEREGEKHQCVVASRTPQ